jgi:hypothetical protein
MAAVLAVALDDYQQYAHAQNVWERRRFVAIDAWFASDGAGWPFSFVNICAALELDVSAVRAELRSWAAGRIHARVQQFWRA